jgi:hypothetical protein
MNLVLDARGQTSLVVPVTAEIDSISIENGSPGQFVTVLFLQDHIGHNVSSGGGNLVGLFPVASGPSEVTAESFAFNSLANEWINIVPEIVDSTSLILPSGEDVGSTANAYVVNPSPPVTATYGASFTFTTPRANTNASTMNASGTGALPFRTSAGRAFTGGEIPGSGQVYQVTFDGNEWCLAGVIGAGNAANPAGTLNLAGAYLIPVGPVPAVNGGPSSGFTLMSQPLNSGTGNRQMMTFLLNNIAEIGSQYASFGFDGDDVFLLTGNCAAIALEMALETFDPVSIFNQGTGTSLEIQQNNVPAAGATAIRLLQPIGTGNATIWGLDATDGTVTTYNGIATVSGGQPAEYATVDLIGQTAAITTTNLYTPTATGMFRISVYAKVTTPDGASSSLGGSAGLTIGYTDGDDSVAQTTVAQLAKETGAAGIVNAGNTTATKLLGTVIIFAKTGVAITYAFDYTSGTPAAMAYELHLKLEAL